MLRLSQPVADPRRLAAANLQFWIVTPPTGGWTYIYCIERRDAVAAALDKVLASGVKSYHVGSRGLERLSIPDLLDLLKFWSNAANDAALGVSSAIQSRRAAPCDV